MTQASIKWFSDEDEPTNPRPQATQLGRRVVFAVRSSQASEAPKLVDIVHTSASPSDTESFTEDSAQITVAENYADFTTEYCEAVFEAMNEQRLSHLIQGRELRPGDLTFAAEVAGRRLTSAEVLPILRDLLASDSPLVREGAAYGLSHHLAVPEARTMLKTRLSGEKNWGVAQAITEILEGA